MDGLHGLHGAIAAREENALAIRLFNQGQAVALFPQPGVALDEIVFVHPEELRDRGDLSRPDLHLSRPAAAVRAALALVVDLARHGWIFGLLWRKFVFIFLGN